MVDGLNATEIRYLAFFCVIANPESEVDQKLINVKSMVESGKYVF